MKKAFEMFDAEGKGTVSVDDLSRVVSKYTGVEVKKEEAQEYFDHTSPVLGLSEFADLFTKLRSVQVSDLTVIMRQPLVGVSFFFNPFFCNVDYIFYDFTVS